MAVKTVKGYFMEQIKTLVQQSLAEPEGFAAYFSDHEPKDQEILGFIAVTTMLSGKYHLAERYPTPAEALASLPAAARGEICNEFRQQLRACQHRRPSA